MLAGLIFGSVVMLGVCCWHFLRGHNIDLFRKGVKLALIVAVPVTLLQLVVGNRFGEAVTSAQSMKIAAPFHALRAPFLARTRVNAITRTRM
jgi:cytochrome d ubiquinol oxidase subunit I